MYSIAVAVCVYIKYAQTLTTILDSVSIPTISKITVRTDVLVGHYNSSLILSVLFREMYVCVEFVDTVFYVIY